MHVIFQPWIKIVAAFLLGASTVWSFAPYNYWPVAWLSLFALFTLAYQASRLLPSLLFAFHFGLFCFGLSWVKVSMVDFGGLLPVTAFMLISLLAAYLAIYYAAVGWLWCWLSRLSSDTFAWLFSLPALWLLADWARGNLLTGFPWLWFGYGQIDSPLASLAPIFGVQGITLVLLWTVLATTLLTKHGKRVYQPALFGWLLALLLYPFHYVEFQKPVHVALVQGNIAQSLKWEPEYLAPTIDIYTKLTETISPKTQMIVWPESSLPEFEYVLYPFLRLMDISLKQKQQALIAGLLAYDEKKDAYYNGLLALGDVGADVPAYRLDHDNRYYKQHLLPIGEYVPFEDIFRNIAPFFNLPMSSFQAGQINQPALRIKEQQAAPAICYEIAFSEDLRRKIKQETTFIITVSNDAWFGYSIGPWQHAQIARMRALEFGRPVLRATNTGVTQIIDHRGHVTAQLPRFERQVLEASFHPTTGQTPYQRWGSYPLIFLMMSLLFFPVIKKALLNFSLRPKSQTSKN